ncbi:30S ribosomal protein S2 [Candidatus Nitrosocosmicus arcticus]|uniref:Small ribosomal subunit protein uS2 n=2 Tax=Nitrososphaeraceae TaxID=1033997 RepID=A0A557SVR9_9ARCH|nr:30S ribosomal protein S2 [Candidatus Nitrosocosmicus arcticus]
MEQYIMNMKPEELDSLNNSNNEHLDKTVNDATSKPEDEESTNTTSNADETSETSDQIEQPGLVDEGSSSSSEMVEQSESLEDPNNLEKMILSTGIRVGTPIKTKFMTSFITRANPEGLYILDISKTLARIDVAAKFIGRTNIANVAVTSAREYGKTPIEKFCELTGARGIFGRFMPGTFTNPSLPKYLEPEIVIVTDPQADEQAVLEATRAGVPVIALSNSDNITSKVDLVIPSNNRGRKALATVYWLLTKEVLKKQGKIKSDSEMPLTIDDFEAKLVEELI